MTATDTIRGVGLSVLLVLSAIILVVPTVGTAAADKTTNNTLVVDESGGAQFTEIQAAVSAASAGDTIEVRPGTYDGGSGRFVVTLDKNVTLVAPQSATINASGDSLRVGAIEILGNAAPTIEGFTITAFENEAIDAWETTGSWTLRNISLEYCGSDGGTDGIQAGESTGDWGVYDVSITSGRFAGGSDCSVLIDTGVGADESTGDWEIDGLTVQGADFRGVGAFGADGSWAVRNATIRNADFGVQVGQTTGDWVIESTRIMNHTERSYGIAARNTAGDWTIRDTVVANNSGNSVGGILMEAGSGNWTVENTTVRDQRFNGIDIEDAAGAWTITDSTLEDNEIRGIEIRGTSGAWTITDSTIRNNGADGIDIENTNTTVPWEIHESAFTGHSGEGLNARNVGFQAGNATCNWWGASDGPSGDFSGSGDAATGDVHVEPYYTNAAMTAASGSDCAGTGMDGGDGPDGPGDGGGQTGVEQYENSNGVVTTNSLQSALSDWGSGSLTTDQLIQVLTAWGSGG